jgi:hypothetical protein
VRPETVEGWRADALARVEEAMRRGGGPSPRERDLEREVRDLRAAVADLSIDKALLKRELDKCRPPSGPARSR